MPVRLGEGQQSLHNQCCLIECAVHLPHRQEPIQEDLNLLIFPVQRSDPVEPWKLFRNKLQRLCVCVRARALEIFHQTHTHLAVHQAKCLSWTDGFG